MDACWLVRVVLLTTEVAMKISHIKWCSPSQEVAFIVLCCWVGCDPQWSFFPGDFLSVPESYNTHVLCGPLSSVHGAFRLHLKRHGTCSSVRNNSALAVQSSLQTPLLVFISFLKICFCMSVCLHFRTCTMYLRKPRENVWSLRITVAQMAVSCHLNWELDSCPLQEQSALSAAEPLI